VRSLALLLLPGCRWIHESRDGKDSIQRITARLKADTAKRALGERAVVWWTDGDPDYHRYLAATKGNSYSMLIIVIFRNKLISLVKILVGRLGLEPRTKALKGPCSTN
jgi:hypothetical protein